jgi:peroxidase
LAVDTQQEIDTHIVDGVRNFLFGEPLAGAGEDLASLNIQRGRDHGLPDYNTIRVAFGLPALTSFNQITSDPQTQAALRAVYGTTGGVDNVNLVDPWVGGLAEDHLPGMDVGPLIAASLIEQFTSVRDGDRFWFTRDSGLTSDELNFAENVTLADIIEDNTGLTNLQSNVFIAAVPEPTGLVLATIALMLFPWAKCKKSHAT